MEKVIRILQIVPNMQQGGLENFIMNVYRNIDRNKIQFDFLVHYTEKKYYDDEIEAMGGRIYRFSLRDDNNILKYMKELDLFYKSHKEYKVIHCHMSSIGFINFIIAKKNNVNVKIAHSHNSSTDDTFKGRVKRLMMLPYKYISDINFACSKEAGEYLFKNKKYEVIPNAIDVKKFMYNVEDRMEIRRRYSINQDAIVIGHIGRFNVQKNHKFIIDTFYEYNKIQKKSYLILIGVGELMPKIKQYIKNLMIDDKVIFVGNISDTYKYYSTFDIFVLPSLFEGLPLVGIEAQANGVQCLFSNKVTSEIEITDLITYLPLNKEDWIKKILKLKVKNDRKKYNLILQNSKFNVCMIAEKLQKRYIELYNREK